MFNTIGKWIHGLSGKAKLTAVAIVCALGAAAGGLLLSGVATAELYQYCQTGNNCKIFSYIPHCSQDSDCTNVKGEIFCLDNTIISSCVTIDLPSSCKATGIYYQCKGEGQFTGKCDSFGTCAYSVYNVSCSFGLPECTGGG